jgi:hypothetical protein
MYKPWSSTTSVPLPPLDRPVWVDLDQLYGEPDEGTAAVDDPPPGGYLKATGRVPGLLKRWARAIDGRWFGRVDFSVCDSYGAVQARHEGVLVPAAALSVREVEPRR